jgi:hypothetical protein
MQTNNNSEYKQYFIGDDELNLVCLDRTYINENNKFGKWLIELEKTFDIHNFDDWEFGGWQNEYFVFSYDSICGYNVPEDWRFCLIDDIAMKPTIDEIDTFIGELGIRTAFQLADECGFYEEEDYKKALTSREGLRRMFFCILYAIIITNPELREVDECEYRKIKNKNDEEVCDESEDE